MKMADFQPEHFQWRVDGTVATVTLDRPERKNPLTFESYAELRDTFRRLTEAEDVDAVVITGAGENFCSGGDVHEIIGPLTRMDMKGLLRFTRMTGDLVKAIRGCPQPVLAAVDGVSMPLLRQRELAVIVDKANVSLAICDRAARRRAERSPLGLPGPGAGRPFRRPG